MPALPSRRLERGVLDVALERLAGFGWSAESRLRVNVPLSTSRPLMLQEAATKRTLQDFALVPGADDYSDAFQGRVST